MTISEKEIVKGFNRGDIRSFEKVFDKTYRNLCYFVNRYVNDDEIAEDIIQEMFIKLFEDKKQFTTYIALKVYLFRSARNSVLNFLKKKKYETQLDTDSAEKIESDDSYLDMITETEIVSQLNQAITQLPKKCQEIISMCVSGLNNNEIAEELNVSVNTIKTQKKIGYKLLRESLKDSFILLILLF